LHVHMDRLMMQAWGGQAALLALARLGTADPTIAQ
jgi:hypothetical protein